MKILDKKKGVSEVVSIVLIIMITVAAIAILWAIVIPLVKDSIEKGNLCFNAQSDVSIISDSGYTCVNTTALQGNGSVSVQVKKGADDRVLLENLTVIITLDTGSSVSRSFSNIPSSNGVITETFDGTSSEKLTGAISVKVAPTLRVGNTLKTCDASQEVRLVACN